MRSVKRERMWYLVYAVAFAALAIASVVSLIHADELSLGRKPWDNLLRTVSELGHPSFLDLWVGPERLAYKDADGNVLRVENRRQVEASFLRAVAEASWTTVKIATLGTLAASIIALPLGVASARNLHASRWVAYPARGLADSLRSIHTLVFGLIFVGIVGLGPVAGIAAIAAHSAGTLAKLYAEAIESLENAPIEAVRLSGASRPQLFFLAIWPAVLPQFTSLNLYVLEFNIRDSAVLGLIGAGGLGLLISEATSLFQWGRLATLLTALVSLVALADAVSRRIRRRLL